MGDDPYVANAGNSKSTIRVYGRQYIDNWTVTFSIEQLKKDQLKDEVYGNVSAEHRFPSFGRIAASYGYISNVSTRLIDKSTYSGDGNGFSLGGFYNWIKGGGDLPTWIPP